MALFRLAILLFFLCVSPVFAQQILVTKGLIAFWDFKEEAGQARIAQGKGTFPLTEQNGTIPRIPEGPCLVILPGLAIKHFFLYPMKQPVN
ncbi:MAG: hypothetical protein R3C61_02375 [Bacteroidia bacterium]